MKPDYTQLFQWLQITDLVAPEFPLDLLSPAEEKKLGSQARALYYDKKGNQPYLSVGGACVTADLLKIHGYGTSHAAVKEEITDKINSYCKEMFRCERLHDCCPSNKKNRVIVHKGLNIFDDPKHTGCYYVWYDMGFVILRK